MTAWGASFVEDAAEVSVDAAVAAMLGFYAGVVAGRIARQPPDARARPARLLALALAVTALGFAVLWPASSTVQAVLGLLLVGLGLGNLFPLGLAVTVALAPGRAQFASSRAVLASSAAVLLAPLTVGALADATSLTAALAVVPVCSRSPRSGSRSSATRRGRTRPRARSPASPSASRARSRGRAASGARGSAGRSCPSASHPASRSRARGGGSSRRARRASRRRAARPPGAARAARRSPVTDADQR